MELLIPSLVVLIVATAIAIFVLPRVAPNVLLITSAVLLGYAVLEHYKRFGITEYERATWIYSIKDYMGYIVLAIIILGAYGFYVMNVGTSGSMPALSAPTSGGGMGTIARTVRSRIGELVTKGRISLD